MIAIADACAQLRRAHAYENNEEPELRILKLTLQNAQDLYLCSSVCLNLRRASSTPCAMLENSRDSTFFSRYSIKSKGRATVNDFLRDVLDIDAKCFKLIINTPTHIASQSCNLHEGASKHGKQRSISERAESQEERAAGKRTRDPRDRMDKGSEQKYRRLHDRGVLPGIPHERGLVQGGSGRWRIGANARRDSHREVAPRICISVLRL